MNTAFRDLKTALSMGAGHCIGCPACNGHLSVTSGSKNITVVACNHLRGVAWTALMHLGLEMRAVVREFDVKTPEQIANGAWDGVEFKIKK